MKTSSGPVKVKTPAQVKKLARGLKVKTHIKVGSGGLGIGGPGPIGPGG